MIAAEGHEQGDEVESTCYAGLVSFDLRPKGEGQSALRIREERVKNKKWRHTVKGVPSGPEHNEDSVSNGETGEDQVEEAEGC